MTELPVPITVSVLVACVVAIVAVATALYRGAVLAGVDRRPARRLALGAGLAQAAWLAITAGVAATGIYAADADETVPWIGVGLAVPLVLGAVALRRPLVRAALTHPRTPALLAAVQTFRIVGGVFLVLLAGGQLPAGFALPAGIGDVLVGLAAPAVAVALWRRPQRRALGLAFNAFGLLDLVAAVSLGVALAPGPLQAVLTEPTTVLMGLLPMVLVPTMAVPLAVLVHLVSFALLRAPRALAAAVPAAS
jgi:hypothetical protein